ncbi:hypothetical protein V5F79_22310 [Xanthobacter flavus]|uniref:hypothetical protein n=1 Tax=Xanthobacter flavus TaxID=281 RepID=UPI00372C6BC3
MPSPHPISKIVRELASLGLTQAQTARQVQRTAAYISMIAKREGIDFKAGKPGPKCLDDQDAIEVPIPHWVPGALREEYADHARLYGEEAAASHVRRMKAEAARC